MKVRNLQQDQLDVWQNSDQLALSPDPLSPFAEKLTDSKLDVEMVGTSADSCLAGGLMNGHNWSL